ncbi:MAG: alpha/beta hydrolase [Candidatus Dormibacteraeota bacterium]|uniref:Alpha/beta hydrolase n=1 Tax=Candidatus Dormiibacter inghamiae TaxID=3127013 RepID=A0A934KJY3_9BACT|nr:alpha/beta hydrolase [Candidatus Dormibacteraeota bacterium]MBJ7606761.1 alpha/beta hydrolase [Candidatus Dormibacteraeota bacterium]
MNTVASRDGTTIAYDRVGSGPAVILIAGALCSRLSWSGPELARLLAADFTVYNYDRRGRGDSGDTKPYAVDREVEDIEAIIAEAGGTAPTSRCITSEDPLVSQRYEHVNRNAGVMGAPQARPVG